MRRRHRKNPVALAPLLLVAGSVAAVGAGAFFFFRKKRLPEILTAASGGAQFTTVSPPENQGGMPLDQFRQILKGDCVTVDVALAGLDVPGVPDGNLSMTVTAPPLGSTLTAIANDPRVPEGSGPLEIRNTSVTGAGPCS